MVRRRTRISDARHRPTPAESLHLSGRCSWAKRVNAIEVASPAAIRRNVLLDGGRFFREEMIFANPANLAGDEGALRAYLASGNHSIAAYMAMNSAIRATPPS